jgi:methanogenic corrinoid protein MtbC1
MSARDTESLMDSAAALPAVSPAASEAYEAASPDLVGMVDGVVFSHPDLESFLGGLPKERLHVNHVHHASLLAVVFRYGIYRQLAALLPWVYRAYHRHGTAFAYFPVALAAWRDAVRDRLGGDLGAEILRVYDWLLAVDPQVVELSSLPSPFRPLPCESPWHEMREHLAEGLLAGNWRLGLAMLDGMSKPRKRLEFFDHALRGAMYEVGRRWEEGIITVAHEHLATAAVARLLSALPLPDVPEDRRKGRAVVAATANEYHEMGAWLVADALEQDGWTVRFLGANTPVPQLAGLVAEEQPELLALSATMPFNLCHVETSIREIRALPDGKRSRILVGGLAFMGEAGLHRRLGADAMAQDCREVVAQAAAWWGDAPRAQRN